MSLAYRGLEHVAVARFEELASRRTEQIRGLAQARAVFTRRVARVAGGGAGTLGAVVVFIAAIGRMVSSSGFFGSGSADGALTHGLLGSWALAFTVYVLARLGARIYIDDLLARPIVREGDAMHDLARLEAADPAHVLQHRATRIEGWSAALPLTMLAFLMPLTIHFFVGLLLESGSTRGLTAKSYDEWVAVSVAIVGHAHLVLALFALHFGLKLATRDTVSIRSSTHSKWAKAWGFTILAGAVPGALFFLIPPILVALTGVVFIPAMFIMMGRRIATERGVFETA